MDDKRLDELLSQADKDMSFTSSRQAKDSLNALGEEIIAMSEKTEVNEVATIAASEQLKENRPKWMFAAAASLLLLLGIGAVSLLNSDSTQETNLADRQEVDAETTIPEDSDGDEVGEPEESLSEGEGLGEATIEDTIIELGADETLWLQSPSENILCIAQTSGIECQLTEFNWQAPGEAECEDDFVDGLVGFNSESSTVNTGACITDCSTVSCIWTTEGEPTPTTFEYGETLVAGEPGDLAAYTCTSSQSGIACINGLGAIMSVNRTDNPEEVQEFWTELTRPTEEQGEEAVRLLLEDPSLLDDSGFEADFSLALASATEPVIDTYDAYEGGFGRNTVQQVDGALVFNSYDEETINGNTTESAVSLTFAPVDDEYVVINAFAAG